MDGETVNATASPARIRIRAGTEGSPKPGKSSMAALIRTKTSNVRKSSTDAHPDSVSCAMALNLLDRAQPAAHMDFRVRDDRDGGVDPFN